MKNSRYEVKASYGIGLWAGGESNAVNLKIEQQKPSWIKSLYERLMPLIYLGYAFVSWFCFVIAINIVF